MGSQHLNLKWRNHHSNMLTVFPQLLISEAFADVTLACDGASLRAHKVILSACSPFFHSLFSQHPCKHPIVILKDVSFDDLKVLVNFMYHGEVNITQERLPSFLQTAEALKVKGLSESEAQNRMDLITKNSQSTSLQTGGDKRAISVPSKIAPKKRKKVRETPSNDNSFDNGNTIKENSAPKQLASADVALLSGSINDLSTKGEAKGSSWGGEQTDLQTNDKRTEGMPFLRAESMVDDLTEDSEPPVLPLGNDASLSSNNILEVESYRQLQQMARLLHLGAGGAMMGPHAPLPLPLNSFMSKPSLSTPSGGETNNEDDEEDEEYYDYDKPVTDQPVEDEEYAPNMENVHKLTRLPRHKKKDCIVCGNRAAGVRRRSRQWCPGCNAGVHVHCFNKLVHYKRHPRRNRSDHKNLLSSLAITAPLMLVAPSTSSTPQAISSSNLMVASSSSSPVIASSSSQLVTYTGLKIGLDK